MVSLFSFPQAKPNVEVHAIGEERRTTRTWMDGRTGRGLPTRIEEPWKSIVRVADFIGSGLGSMCHRIL
jgi:hypothetical protein